MTVSQRLLLLASVSTLGLTTTSAVGFYQMERVSETAGFAATNVVPSYRILASILDRLTALRETALLHILTTDETQMRALEKTLDQASADVDDAFKRYVSTGCGGASCLADETERKLIDNLRGRVNAYNEARLKVMGLSRQNKNREAEALMHSTIPPLIRDLDTAVDDELEYNVKLADASVARAAEAKVSATRLSIAITIAALVLLALLSLI